MSGVHLQALVESRGPSKGEGKGLHDRLTPSEAEEQARVVVTAEASGKGGRPNLVRPLQRDMLRPKQKGGQPDMLRPKQKGGQQDMLRPKPQWVPKPDAKGG
eukprot:9330788-Alexandrium_andersonii.AAC.1